MAPLEVYIITFNCARRLVDIDAFAAHFFLPYRQSNTFPDLIVLSLQEIAPFAQSFLGGSLLAKYISHFIAAVRTATSQQQKYRHVFTRNVGLTGIILLAKPDAYSNIRWIETAGVGVGFQEMGNKGAVGVRIGYAPDGDEEEVPMTFVAAHLAAMEDAVQRKNLDWKNIVIGLAFEPTTGFRHVSSSKDFSDSREGESDPLPSRSGNNSNSETSNAPKRLFVSGSPVFVAGDLNYRTSDTSPKPKVYLSFPQPTDDYSDPKHYSHLLASDQLGRERRLGNTLQYLAEAGVDFPPTYKYSSKQQKQMATTGSHESAEPPEWDWVRHRYPSWCDRILFSHYLSQDSTSFKVLKYTALPIQPTSDHRPVALAFQLDIQSVNSSRKTGSFDFKSIYPLNPRWKEQRVAARRKEVLFGILTYFCFTWEGGSMLLALIIVSIGGWHVLKSLITSTVTILATFGC